ncbi:TIGR02221 family CRISPR-associated protein [Halosquirtibacter laminarini]|uniref:TIGR02221 family CRISPR-associated protein n=1 Tax=Halosquirtibacter laminarini TaxID=3374600 RepID=A0AC61NKX1_9BACT|nr:TIGR02221 family CRISPR-associated protein [Prolixibacteraceae bacterium]
MARKVFISFLGSSGYKKCCYQLKDYISAPIRFIQEATLEALGVENWDENDKGYILLTDGVKGSRNCNWEVGIENQYAPLKDQIEYKGLKPVLESHNWKFKIEEISIPDGNNEIELWEIFNRLYEVLQDDDELYLDITHGFRYLPMLMLVLSNYSKFLKGVRVRHISYGNFEGGFENPATKIITAPIIELTSFSEMQEWTSAASDFVQYGQTKGIESLLPKDSELGNNLHEYTTLLQTVRGGDLIKNTQVDNLRCSLDSLDSVDGPKPLSHLADRMKSTVAGYKEDSVLNGFVAVRYCIDTGLYQQGYTLLEEFIITKVMEELGVLSKYFTDKDVRNSVSGALNVNKLESYSLEAALSPRAFEKCSKLDESDFKSINSLSTLGESVFELPYFSLLRKKVFKSLSPLRNDFAHVGMNNNPNTGEKLIQQLKDKFQKTCEIFNIDLE